MPWRSFNPEPITPVQHTRLQAFRACCQKDPHRVEVAEWTLSFTLLVVGTHTLFYPEVISLSHMRLITSTIPPHFFALICMWLGVARIAFILQRPSRFSFRARAVLAIISSAIWLEMIIAFLYRYVGIIIPPGFDMLCITQFIGDLWVVYRIKSHAQSLRRKGLIK